MVVGAVQAGELFEPGMEDLLGTGQAIATRLTFLVQTGKLDTDQNLSSKAGVTRRRIEDAGALNDDRPRGYREAYQNQHDKLNQQARLQE